MGKKISFIIFLGLGFGFFKNPLPLFSKNPRWFEGSVENTFGYFNYLCHQFRSIQGNVSVEARELFLETLAFYERNFIHPALQYRVPPQNDLKIVQLREFLTILWQKKVYLENYHLWIKRSGDANPEIELDSSLIDLRNFIRLIYNLSYLRQFKFNPTGEGVLSTQGVILKILTESSFVPQTPLGLDHYNVEKAAVAIHSELGILAQNYLLDLDSTGKKIQGYFLVHLVKNFCLPLGPFRGEYAKLCGDNSLFYPAAPAVYSPPSPKNSESVSPMETTLSPKNPEKIINLETVKLGGSSPQVQNPENPEKKGMVVMIQKRDPTPPIPEKPAFSLGETQLEPRGESALFEEGSVPTTPGEFQEYPPSGLKFLVEKWKKNRAQGAENLKTGDYFARLKSQRGEQPISETLRPTESRFIPLPPSVKNKNIQPNLIDEMDRILFQ